MTVSVEQAQSSLAELIEKTARGERVVITRDHKPVAELVAAPRPTVSEAATKGMPRPAFGSCHGMLTIVAEDDEHLGDFAEYMK